MVRHRRNTDRSKYRNTDMPVDENVRKRPKLENVRSGTDNDDELFILSDYIDNSGVDNDRKFGYLGDFEFNLSDTDDCIIIEDTDHSNHNDDVIPVDVEMQEKRRKEKRINYSSDDSAVIPVNIDKEVHIKRRKERKIDYSSDDGAIVPVYIDKEVHKKRRKEKEKRIDYSREYDAVIPVNIDKEVHIKRKKERRIDYSSDDSAVIPVNIDKEVHNKRRKERRIDYSSDDSAVIPMKIEKKVHNKRRKERRIDYSSDDSAVIPMKIEKEVHNKRRKERRIDYSSDDSAVIPVNIDKEVYKKRKERKDYSRDDGAVVPVYIDKEVYKKRRKEKRMDYSRDYDALVLEDPDKNIHKKRRKENVIDYSSNDETAIPYIDKEMHKKRKTEKRIDYSNDDDAFIPEDIHKKVHNTRRKENRIDHFTDDDAVIHADINEEVHEKRRKEKRIKRELTVNTPSDSDSSQSSHELVRPSPSPERNPPNTNVQLEPLESKHMLGYYHCDVCNITMTSECNYNNHVYGKRHHKNLKAKNIPEAVAQSIPGIASSENKSKYPKPRPGVIRKKIQKRSQIQDFIEANVKKPCPGLNFVTEIQGIEGVQYYCSMCESVCSSNSILAHLTGYNHQLHSVEKLKPGIYEMIYLEPKYKIQRQIINILQGIQKKDGIGRMAVEIEELALTTDMPFDRNESSYRSQPSGSKNYRNIPSTSRETSMAKSGASFGEIYNKASVPNQSSSDFYCEICDSHMNSQLSWDAHTRGKRHIINLKKLPGDLPSKNKTVAVNRKPYIYSLIKYECPDEPIVGLGQIKETLISKPDCYSYQCFLCGGSFTHHDIIEHLISLKHRTKYLEHIHCPIKKVIAGLSETSAIYHIRKICIDVEKKRGPGEPSVHISKSIVFH